MVPEDSFVSCFRNQQIGYSVYRLVLSRFNRLLKSILFGMRHARCQLGESVRENSSPGNAPCLEKVIEIPSVYLERLSGESKATGLKPLIRPGLETFTLARIALGNRGKARDLRCGLK
jgi:hypothetical protein